MTHLPVRSARRRTAVVSSVCLTAALLGVAPSAWAAGTGHPADAGSAAATGVTSFAVSPADTSAATDYWTPERRATAIDVDSGQPVSALDASDAAAPISTAEQVAPVPHIGRIFYEQGGSRYACSANVVQSANRSTIATAGHCITQNQVFSTDMVFEPAYESGDAPYGTWPVVGGAVTDGWYQDNGDQGDDTGFLAVGTDADGHDITSVVGASPVLFDQPSIEAAAAYGYPAALRFDGMHLERCRGVTERYTAEQISLSCDMNEGTSGSPIFAGDDADGAQFANVANRYADYSHILAPIWQTKERSAYDAVTAIHP